MALILTMIMLVFEHGLFGSCASDDEYSALLQAPIKNHLVDAEVTNSSSLEASTGVAKVKLGYCGGNRVGLGADKRHGTNAGSLDDCAKFALSDDRCHAGGYFDATGAGNNYQCKCPTGSCQVNNPPKSGGWTIYKAEAEASTKVPAPRPTAAPAPRPRPTPAPAPVSAASPGWTYYKVTCSTQPGIETVQASTMDACQEACQKNLECKGFKWFGYKHPDEGHCFLGDDRKDWAGRRTIADKVAGQQAVTQAEAKDERTACAVYDRDAAAAGSGGVAGSGGEDLGGVYIAATAGSDCPSGSEQMDELDCSLASGDLGKKYLGSMCLSSTSGPSYNKRGCLMNGGAGNIMFHSCASTRPVMTKNRALCKKPATIGPFAPSPAVLPSIDTAMQNRYFYLQDKDTITPLERNAKSKCVLISGSHPKLGDAKANCYPLASNIKMLKVTAVYEGNTWFYLRTIDYDYCLELKSGGSYGTHAEITKRCGKSEMGGYQYSHFKLRSFSDDFGRQGTPGVNEIGGPFMLESKVLPNHCLKQRGNDLALGSCNKGFYFWTAPVKR